MRSDGNDCDDGNSFLGFGFIGPIVPEDAVRPRSVVLGVCLEDSLAICPSQRSELVCVKAGMMRVYFQVTEGLANLLKDPCLRGNIFEFGVLLVRGGRELNFSLHTYSLACLANEPR